MGKRYCLNILVFCMVCCLMGCGTSKNNAVKLFDWGISYDELKKQMQETYENVTCVDENYGCSTKIEDYNGDKGVTADIAYSCNDTTHMYEGITILLNANESEDYDIDSLYEKYKNEFTKTYGTPDEEGTFSYKWSTDDESITLITTGTDGTLFIIYESE